MELLSNLMLGMSTAISPEALLYCFIGVFIGTLVGVLPGIGVMPAISLLLPITYYLDSTLGIIMLAGVYYGAAYGGSTAAILLNLPGTPASAITCLDGYPMARQGRAGVALFMTTVASFVGSMAGLVALVLFAPALSSIALSFGPAEYFAVMLLGLVAASAISAGSALRGLAMVVLGLLLGVVGTDITTGVVRFHFGYPELIDGISLIALAMGLFGLGEIVNSVGRVPDTPRERSRITLRSMIPTRPELRQSLFPMLRGSGIGGFFGALPGVGGSVASFMAYAVEKRVSRDPSRFGHGAIEGLTSPEAANNAQVQTAFIPSLTLGIPGDAVMALMLGALILHGISPGPLLISQQPVLFWSLIASFAVGNILLVILNIPLIGIWTRMLLIPYRLLFPIIIVLICIGVYSTNNSTFDILLCLVFGGVGYVLLKLNFSFVPLLLGFVLGPLLEDNLRRALVISRGDMTVFLERPISAGLLAATAAILVYALWSGLREKRKSALVEPPRE